MRCSAWFTVIYLLGDGTEQTITVDGEEILLRVTEATDRERLVGYTAMDNFMYIYCYQDAKVSWSFECYIKDIQRT